MDEIIEQVRAEHLKTGRDVREILEAMRDEGYIDCDELIFEEMVERSGNQQK
jgi:hypothetical protein